MQDNQPEDVDSKRSRLNRKAKMVAKAQQYDPNPEQYDPLFDGLTEEISHQSQIHDLQQAPEGKALLNLLHDITEQQALSCDPVMRKIIARNLKEAARKYEQKPSINLLDWSNTNPLTDLLSEKPPEQEFIFKGGWVPCGRLTTVPAANGVGKSMLLCELAIIACLGYTYLYIDDNQGSPFMDPVKPCKVLILSFEDGRSQFISRIHRIIDHFPMLAKNKEKVLKAIFDNLQIIDVPDITDQNLLTCMDSTTNKVIPDDAYSEVSQLIQRDNFDLVMLDPFHYTTSANENDNGLMGQHVKLLDKLATASGAAIIAWAHCSDANPFRARGATSIADRSRQIWKLTTISRMTTTNIPEVKKLGYSIAKELPKGSLKNYLLFQMDKNSYAQEDSRTYYFQRHDDGVLSLHSMHNSQAIDDVQKIFNYLAECEHKAATLDLIWDAIGSDLNLKYASMQKKLKGLRDSKRLRALSSSEVKAYELGDFNSNSNVIWYTVYSPKEQKAFEGF